MEPCLSVASSDAHAPSRVNANVVWEHEVQRCLYLCQEISTDERVTASLDVMLALEDAMSFRIGELRSLHLCDITFCDDYMEVHFHPFADEHSGKTRQARRIMRTGVRFCIVTVRQWRDRPKRVQQKTTICLATRTHRTSCIGSENVHTC